MKLDNNWSFIMTVESSIRTYVLENYLFTDDESELDSNDSFLEKGIIDSTGVLEIILYLEEEFRIKIADHEIIPENLDSVVNLVNFIDKKTTLKETIIFDNGANTLTGAGVYELQKNT